MFLRKPAAKVQELQIGGTGEDGGGRDGSHSAPLDRGRSGMHLVLLPLGLIVGVAGIVLLGFGVPNHAEVLGNTLIIAGALSLVGGLGLIGMASAIRQLRRIAKAIEARPGTLVSTPGEIEPRLPMPVVSLAPARVSGGEHAEPVRSEPAVVTTPEPEPAPRREPTVAPVAAANAGREAAARPEPTSSPEQKITFDAIWSTRPGEPPPDKAAPAPTAPDIASAPASRAAQDVKIFKSGVIDGMAYTLYTDGSIEAELAQGTVKFSSIDELRAYLTARE